MKRDLVTALAEVMNEIEIPEDATCWLCQEPASILLLTTGQPMLFSCLQGTPGEDGHMAQLMAHTKDWGEERTVVPCTQEANVLLGGNVVEMPEE